MDIIQFRKIILIFVLIGLLFLILYSHFYSFKKVNLLELNNNYLDNVISVSGSVRDLSIKNNTIFFKICVGSKCVDSVLFNSTNTQKNFLLEKNNKIEKIVVNGKYTLYKDSPELIIYSIIS